MKKNYDDCIQEAEICLQLNEKCYDAYYYIFQALDKQQKHDSKYYTAYLTYFVKTRNYKVISHQFQYFDNIIEDRTRNQLLKEALYLLFISLKGDDTKVNKLFNAIIQFQSIKKFLKQGSKQVKFFYEVYKQALQDKKKQLQLDPTIFGSIEQQILKLKDDLNQKQDQDRQTTIESVKKITNQLLDNSTDNNQNLMQLLPCLFLCTIANNDTEISLLLLRVMNKINYYKAIDQTCQSVGNAIRLNDQIVVQQMDQIKIETSCLLRRQKYQAAYWILIQCDQKDDQILEQLSRCEVKLGGKYIQEAIKNYKILLEMYEQRKQYDKYLLSQQQFIASIYTYINSDQLWKLMTQIKIKSKTFLISSNDSTPIQFQTQNTQLMLFIYGYKYIEENTQLYNFDYKVISYIYPMLINYLLKQCKILGWQKFQPISRALQISFDCQNDNQGCQFYQYLENVDNIVTFTIRTGKNYTMPVDIDWNIVDNIIDSYEQILFLTEKVLQLIDNDPYHCHICKQYRKLSLLFIIVQYLELDLIPKQDKINQLIKQYQQQIKTIAQAMGYDEITYKEVLNQFLKSPNIDQVVQLVDMCNKNYDVRYKVVRKMSKVKKLNQYQNTEKQALLNLAYQEIKLQSKNLQIKELQESYQYFNNSTNTQLFQECQKELQAVLLNILYKTYKSRVQTQKGRENVGIVIKDHYQKFIQMSYTYEDYYNVATIAGFELGASMICISKSIVLKKQKLFVPVNEQLQIKIKFNIMLLQQQLSHFKEVEQLQSEL